MAHQVPHRHLQLGSLVTGRAYPFSTETDIVLSHTDDKGKGKELTPAEKSKISSVLGHVMRTIWLTKSHTATCNSGAAK
jgi:hypothetical protein